MILSDIDGTITDGCMYYNENGHAFKKFEPHINSAIGMLRFFNIPIKFFTSGKAGYSISNKFANAFEVPCALVFPIEERISYIKKTYEEYKDKPGKFVYLGDSDWDAFALQEVFGKFVSYRVRKQRAMDGVPFMLSDECKKPSDLHVACPYNSTIKMKLMSKVSETKAGDGFFYDTIYNLLKET